MKLHWRRSAVLAARVRLGPAGPAWPDRGVLYGQRGLFRPRASAETIQQLGPVRHALAQRAIAGTLEVHAPFAPAAPEPAAKL